MRCLRFDVRRSMFDVQENAGLGMRRRDLAVFLVLAVLVFAGFVYILINFKKPA